MKILFICTHNRCRSILSEAIANQNARGLIEARSAGSQPAGEVHPLSLHFLEKRGYATDGLKSQSWHDFESFEPDLVITVCDSAAGESCPLYFGKSLKVHWGLEDPSKVGGSDEGKESAFMACIDEIERRISRLATLAVEQLDRQALRAALLQLGANE